jgi:hypothetical protein
LALASFLGAYWLNKFAYKPAVGTKGGILLLWNDASIDLSNVSIGRFSLSVDATLRHSRTTFRITAVYGPARHPEKEAFLRNLRNIKPTTGSRWLLLGDFNLIYKVTDKNNRYLNLRLMSRFRRTLNFCELKELALQNRKFTWSNERRHPTLVRLDRVFCNQPWELTFENCAQNALSSSHSDHCPMLLTNQDAPRHPTPFRFEYFWTCLPDFQEVVVNAWNAPTTHTEPFHRLGHKLHTTAHALKRWSGSRLYDVRLKLLMAQEVILHLDEARDSRPLSTTEQNLRAKLKKRILGWLVIEKARKKLCARISHIKEGDANTCFFHPRANGRRRKNFIQQLREGRTWFLNTQRSNSSSKITSRKLCASHRLATAISPGTTWRSHRLT